MGELKSSALVPVFEAVGEALIQKRNDLNQLDSLNGNHGDHMVAIFETATRAVYERSNQLLTEGIAPGNGGELADAMAYAAQKLALLKDNGSAQVYARGLDCVAEQMRQHEITMEELAAYAASALSGDKTLEPERSGEVLRALVAGIAAWNRVEAGKAAEGNALSMGILFDFGIAYLQAKQRGGSRANVIADAAASVSPLGRVPYRLESGKLVMSALLRALEKQAGDLLRAG